MRAIILFCLAAASILALTACGQAATPTPTPPTVPTSTPTPTPTHLTISEIAKRVKPAVVRIESSGGIGTGFVIEPTGWIVTNAHVVGNDRLVRVTLVGGVERKGLVLGRASDEDIALVKIDGFNMTRLNITSADIPEVGNEVLALGYALDIPGESTLTRGLISAIRSKMFGSVDAIQTDTTLNPGNSGGPLLDLDGNVVGITAAGYRDSVGLNLAISIDGARAVLGRLMRGQPLPLGRYINPQVPYSIGIPSTWRVYEVAPDWVVLADTESTGEVHVYAEAVRPGITTDRYAEEKTIAGAMAFRDNGDYEQLLSEELLVSGSTPAWAITGVWQRPQNDFKHQGKEVFFVLYGVGYSIYSQSERNEWQGLEAVFRSILNGLRIDLEVAASGAGLNLIPTPTPTARIVEGELVKVTGTADFKLRPNIIELKVGKASQVQLLNRGSSVYRLRIPNWGIALIAQPGADSEVSQAFVPDKAGDFDCFEQLNEARYDMRCTVRVSQ